MFAFATMLRHRELWASHFLFKIVEAKWEVALELLEATMVGHGGKAPVVYGGASGGGDAQCGGRVGALPAVGVGKSRAEAMATLEVACLTPDA